MSKLFVPSIFLISSFYFKDYTSPNYQNFYRGLIFLYNDYIHEPLSNESPKKTNPNA